MYLSGTLDIPHYPGQIGGERVLMDAGMLQTLIGTLGFPIACVCAMFYMWNKEREDHKTEMEKVTQALNNNTLALTKLEELLRNGHN